MSKEYSDNVLQRGAQGWTDWVRAIVSFGQAEIKKPARLAQRKRKSTPDLKTSLKPSNKAKLRRDLSVIRRPKPKEEAGYEMVQLKRTKQVIKDLKKVPKNLEEKLLRRVDPPRPFDIDEQYLETPTERKDRVGRFKKKKPPNPFAQPPMSKLRRHLLYLNPGTQKVLDAHRGFVKGTEMPKWTQHLMLGRQARRIKNGSVSAYRTVEGQCSHRELFCSSCSAMLATVYFFKKIKTFKIFLINPFP